MSCIHTIFIWVIQYCIDIFTGHNLEEQFFWKKYKQVTWVSTTEFSLSTLFCFCSKMSLETVPKELRRLRACLLCSLVKVSKNNKPEKPSTQWFSSCLLWKIIDTLSQSHSQQSLFCSYCLLLTCSTICDHHHIGLQLLMHCTIIWLFFPGHFFTVSLIFLHSLWLSVLNLFGNERSLVNEVGSLAAFPSSHFPALSTFSVVCQI